MSALTDLFTALANKIRSKTGEATTYTPLQMVSDGIDDVYQAGVDAGETPTQTKTVTAGTSAVTVTPDTGYALSSVTVNPTPSQSKSATPTTSSQTVTPDSGKLLSQVDIAPIPSQYKIPTQIMPISTPTSMTAGEAYSPTSNAYLIDSYSEVYPSDTYPAALYSGMIKSGGSGYAISSYSSTSKTPSSTGTYFSSGWNRMTSSGYAYSSQPQMTETTLWTNSSPTSNFASQTVTLSEAITTAKFDFIKVTTRISTSLSTEQSTLFPTSEFLQFAQSGTNIIRGYVGTRTTGNYARAVLSVNTTQVSFGASQILGNTTQNNAYIIPIKISGLKL